ncbi:MAG: DUF4139 domain-containing protein [Balneolaceae bacterium]
MNALLLSFLFLFNLQSTTPDSSIVTSEINQVTVFKNQAQIQRTAKVELTSGTTVVVFTGLSETLVDQSIQLKGSGAFTLLSLTTRNDFTEKTVYRNDIQALRDQKKSLEQQIAEKQAGLEVIKSEMNMLASTQEIIKNNKLTPTEINALISLYRENLSGLLNKRIAENSTLEELRNELQKVNRQINESYGRERTSFKEIIAEVQLEDAQSIDFILNYQVYSAGWEAAYDVRSSDINSPLNISYKAKIYQNTGIDWNNVKFTINSGDPTSNATKPELSMSFVGYKSYSANSRRRNLKSIQSNQTSEKGIIRGRILDGISGEPLPAVTVQINELRKGTATNNEGEFFIGGLANGRYILSANFIGFKPLEIPISLYNNGYFFEIPLEVDILGFEEVVVTGVGSPTVRSESVQKLSSIIEPVIIQSVEFSNQTSFSYEIAIPYSVPSDGKHHTVEIKKETPETEYRYSTAPKLSEFAYLQGSIPEWSELNLIKGEANLYFDNQFVGTTFLNPVSLEDTLAISLGKDERIIVEREQLKEFSSKNFFRNKVRENKSYEISIRNSKSEPITITVEDQIPISTNEEIKVNLKEINSGFLNEETGIITWKLIIPPGVTEKIQFSFEVEYPKGKRIVY